MIGLLRATRALVIAIAVGLLGACDNKKPEPHESGSRPEKAASADVLYALPEFELIDRSGSPYGSVPPA